VRDGGGAVSDGGVLLAHPATQHSYQAALALQERGVLRQYVTGAFYYKRSAVAERAVRSLGSRWGGRVGRELGRRRLEGLDPRLVTRSAMLEPLHQIADRFGLPPRIGYRTWQYRRAEFERAAARLVRRMRPAVVVAYDTAATALFAAAREVGAFCVLDQTTGHVSRAVREYRASGLDASDSPETVDARTREALSADLVITSSEYVRASLVDIGVDESRIVVIPYGVDLDRFTPAAEPRDDSTVHALYVGHMSYKKGIQFILDAFRRLSLDGLRLMMVGRMAVDDAWTREFGERLEYFPPRPNSELPALYRSADMYLQMSLHESSALTVFEALASGLPVVTTPNSGSVVRDGVDGFVVPARDVAALAERITELYGNAERRRTMGRNARRRAESFSWARYRERFGGLVADLAHALPRDRPRTIAIHRARLADVMAGVEGEQSCVPGAERAGNSNTGEE
jgi:alpha-maltose-1-phosphate synthase